ncbi:MAG: FAD-dependent oxidoreductase [Peptococcaceae bacterium]|nr:FAD-dependent oxidoreductase [Peptococcaceae bacterium]
MKVVIIGGVAGGASAAARLRRLDEQAKIVLFERGEYISYANCGLPYYVGGEISDKKALTLQTPESFKSRFRVDVRIRQEVIAIKAEEKRVTVKNLSSGMIYDEPYDKLILSPGAEPSVPDLPGIDDPRIFTLRTIPDTYAIRNFIEEKKPASAVIIGGGYIGLEMAENFVAAGLSVTIVQRSDHLIPSLDYDMACGVHHYLRQKGVKLIFDDTPLAFRPQGDENLEIQLKKQILTAQLVLISTGVRPDSGLARGAGLRLNFRGGIVTDRHLQTSNPDIYAVGDAVEVRHFITGQPVMIALAGPANKQGRIAADNICGIPSVFNGSQGSSVLKIFEMTAAATGLNEKTAQAAGLDFGKAYTWSASHASYYPGASNISLKVLFEKGTGRLLGAQATGFDGVDKRLDVLATAIRAGMTAYELTDLELCYAPPFSSAKDPVNMMGYVIENLLTGKVEQFYWHDLDFLSSDPRVQIIDVRSEREFAAGHLEEAINIPLPQLRMSLDKLDAAKRICVICESGLRSYIACRILSQKGYDCAHLAGGWRLYAAVMQEQLCAGDAGRPRGSRLPRD